MIWCRPGADRTWLSFIEEPDENFPEYFTTEDMEAEDIEPNIAGAERAARQYALIRKMLGYEA